MCTSGRMRAALAGIVALGVTAIAAAQDSKTLGELRLGNMASASDDAYYLNFGAGTVQGGAIFTLADFAFAVASNSAGTVAVAINVSITFVKAASAGTLTAEAEEVSVNPKLGTYTVRVLDDTRALIALACSNRSAGIGVGLPSADCVAKRMTYHGAGLPEAETKFR